MGIAGISPGPNLSKRNLEHRIYPYLLRNLAISLTMYGALILPIVRLPRGWMYLVALIDWYSRFVVSWGLDQTLEIDSVLEVVKRALSVGQAEILNSVQGSHSPIPNIPDYCWMRTSELNGRQRMIP